MIWRKQKSFWKSTSHLYPVLKRICLVKGSIRPFARPPKFGSLQRRFPTTYEAPLRSLVPQDTKFPPLVELAIVEEALENLISPFEACAHHTVELGADLFLSSQDHPPDFLAKANVRFRVKGRSPDTQSPTTASKTSRGSNSVCSSSFTDPRDGHLHFEPTVPLSRAAPVFSDQLETPDTGSVHFKHDRGSLNALCRNPTSGTGAPADFSPSATKASNRTKNCGNVTERGSSGDLPPERGIYQYSFLSQNERWGPAMNLKQLNSFALYQHFKNGETKLAKVLNPKGRLDDKTRQERCLLYCANRSTAPTPPSFYLCGHEIPIFVPPIWPKSRTFSIHQAFEPAVALLRRLGLRLIISLDDII